jgi:hypothetical protein
MVKEKKVKKQQKLENEEKTKICRLFNITSFTTIQNRKKISLLLGSTFPVEV